MKALITLNILFFGFVMIIYSQECEIKLLTSAGKASNVDFSIRTKDVATTIGRSSHGILKFKKQDDPYKKYENDSVKIIIENKDLFSRFYKFPIETLNYQKLSELCGKEIRLESKF